MTDKHRPTFYAKSVCVLNCTPGNYDHDEGEPASIITLGHVRTGEIAPWVISLADSKLLIAKLLVVLATNGDQFAQQLLDYHFSNDEEGNFQWPD